MIRKSIAPASAVWILAAVFAVSSASGGTTFIVNQSTDATDANPGDGVCDAVPPSGVCTLRAAIQEANALSGPDTIYLSALPYTLTLTGEGEDGAATGDLDILGALNIYGVRSGGTVIQAEKVSGGLGDRVFHVLSGTVTLRQMTIQNGTGGIRVEDGASLRLINATVSGNAGDGVFSLGTLTLSGTTVSGNAEHGIVQTGRNSMVLDSAVSDNSGTGIYLNAAALTLRNSEIRGNSGGGLVGQGSVMTLIDTAVQDNVSNTWGGGILGNTTQVTLTNTTVSRNASNTDGGGIFVSGSLILTNSTISGNTSGSSGGGIFVMSGPLTLRNSTVTRNRASAGGGLTLAASASADLSNSLIAENIAPEAPDCEGFFESALTSKGYNLIGNASGCPVTPSTGDQFGTSENLIDPVLDDLRFNGGPTETHGLLAKSPAIDAGDLNGCKDAYLAALATDQRGFVRHLDGGIGGSEPYRCDIGAFEYMIPGLIVTPTEGLITSESGGQAKFTVALSTQPAQPVSVPIVSQDPGEGIVSLSSITFTSADWNIPQTISVAGVDDRMDDGSVDYTIAVGPALSGDGQFDGLPARKVKATNTDNDRADITVSPVSGLFTTEADGIATFKVVLNTQPTSNVIIRVESSLATEGTASPNELMFNSDNWDEPQTVIVTGVDDRGDWDGDRAYTVVVGPAASVDTLYDGLDPSDVTIINRDDDARGVSVTPASILLTTEAGARRTFHIGLIYPPSGDVTLNLSGWDETEGEVSPNRLVFTRDNWDSPQTVSVTGVDDEFDDGNVEYFIYVSVDAEGTADDIYSGLPAVEVFVRNMDNDRPADPQQSGGGCGTVDGPGPPDAGMLLLLASPWLLLLSRRFLHAAQASLTGRGAVGRMAA